MAAAYISHVVTEAQDHDPAGTRARHRTVRSSRHAREPPRDPEAERAVIEGLRRAPNAAYALVQTALVQDEALKRADARIHALEAELGGAPADRPTGFLDGMRDALLGRRESRARLRSLGASGPRATAGAERRLRSRRGSLAARTGGPRRLLPRHRCGRGRRHDRRLAAARRHPLHDGAGPWRLRVRGSGLRAGREPGSPWDNGAGGDLARQAGIDDIGRDTHTRRRRFGLRLVRRRLRGGWRGCSGRPGSRRPSTTAAAISAAAISAAATFNPSDGCGDKKAARIGAAFRFSCRRHGVQITTTLAPTLTRS